MAACGLSLRFFPPLTNASLMNTSRTKQVVLAVSLAAATGVIIAEHLDLNVCSSVLAYVNYARDVASKALNSGFWHRPNLNESDTDTIGSAHKRQQQQLCLSPVSKDKLSMSASWCIKEHSVAVTAFLNMQFYLTVPISFGAPCRVVYIEPLPLHQSNYRNSAPRHIELPQFKSYAHLHSHWQDFEHAFFDVNPMPTPTLHEYHNFMYQTAGVFLQRIVTDSETNPEYRDINDLTYSQACPDVPEGGDYFAVHHVMELWTEEFMKECKTPDWETILEVAYDASVDEMSAVIHDIHANGWDRQRFCDDDTYDNGTHFEPPYKKIPGKDEYVHYGDLHRWAEEMMPVDDQAACEQVLWHRQFQQVRKNFVSKWSFAEFVLSKKTKIKARVDSPHIPVFNIVEDVIPEGCEDLLLHAMNRRDEEKWARARMEEEKQRAECASSAVKFPSGLGYASDAVSGAYVPASSTLKPPPGLGYAANAMSGPYMPH